MDSAEEPVHQFDRSQLLSLFSELDEVLKEQPGEAKAHLVIGGGAAMMATTMDDRLTDDVDVISEGMDSRLREAVTTVSRRHEGLRQDWLNDAAKLHSVDIPIDAHVIFEGERLSVAAAGHRYLLAMKLAGGRAVDEKDCEHLIRELGVVDSVQLLDLIEDAIPRHLLTPRMAFFSAERIDAAWKRRRWQRWRATRRGRRA